MSQSYPPALPGPSYTTVLLDPLFRVTRDDGTERYVRSSRPLSLHRPGILDVQRIEDHEFTLYIWAASVLDKDESLDWPRPYMRELAIIGIMNGECRAHAIAAAKRIPCSCTTCFPPSLEIES